MVSLGWVTSATILSTSTGHAQTGFIFAIRVNPRANCKGSNRVLRGGSWNNDPTNCRVANRNNNTPDNRNNNIGFRLANTGKCPPEEHFLRKLLPCGFLSRSLSCPRIFGAKIFRTGTPGSPYHLYGRERRASFFCPFSYIYPIYRNSGDT
jgi:hypothetical protein